MRVLPGSPSANGNSWVSVMPVPMKPAAPHSVLTRAAARDRRVGAVDARRRRQLLLEPVVVQRAALEVRRPEALSSTVREREAGVAAKLATGAWFWLRRKTPLMTGSSAGSVSGVVSTIVSAADARRSGRNVLGLDGARRCPTRTCSENSGRSSPVASVRQMVGDDAGRSSSRCRDSRPASPR